MTAKELWQANKERLIPSGTVRAYLEEIGWEPSELELAALLHKQKYASLAEKWEALRSLETQDEALAAQIKGYIHDQERLIQKVMEEEGPYIYALRINDGPMREGENAGYYLSSQQALAVGMRLNEPFAIHKYALPQGGEISDLMSDDLMSDDLMSDYIQVMPEDFDVAQREGCVYCAPDGAITDVWDGWPVGRYNTKHFASVYVEVPTPFKAGDIVWMKRDGVRGGPCQVFGVVTSSKNDWKRINAYGDLVRVFVGLKNLELAAPGDMDQATWRYLCEASKLFTGKGSDEALLRQRYWYKKEKGISLTDAPDRYDDSF